MGTPTKLKLTCIKYLGASACIFYTYSTTAYAIGKNILLGMIPAALYTYILYAARTCVVLCGKFSRDSIFVDRPSLPFNSSQMSATMPVQLCLFQRFIFVASRSLVKIVPLESFPLFMYATTWVWGLVSVVIVLVGRGVITDG